MMVSDTIVALATASGVGAIAVIRLSGPDAIAIADAVFTPQKGKRLSERKTHTIALGHVNDGEKVIDQVLASIFHGPNSYTGEHTVEFSCHGSVFIQQQLIQLLLRRGCRMANPGEFTLRAFLNGKLDLSQAEAVADLISSDNEAAHQMAMQQMRGGFSGEIKQLRTELLNFASLLELELDFSEEDVEFADRSQFRALLNRIETVLRRLIDSFAVGNVLKNGIPVAIVGAPNVGKSTLLNALLNEDRAIVSDIAGTTRDTVEDEISIGGIGFRFIDTAGIRQTQDTVEQIGIRKTYEKITQAQIIIYLVDASTLTTPESITSAQSGFAELLADYPDKAHLLLGNKKDKLTPEQTKTLAEALPQMLMLSAKDQTSVQELEQRLLGFVNTGALRNSETIVTNTRHYDALLKAFEAVKRVSHGLQSGLSGDLLAIDLREALHHFGMITGEVSSDELLGNIFANFCIGK